MEQKAALLSNHPISCLYFSPFCLIVCEFCDVRILEGLAMEFVRRKKTWTFFSQKAIRRHIPSVFVCKAEVRSG